MVLVIGLSVATLLIYASGAAYGASERAKMADDFVGSIGTNTHINYFDTVYNDYPLVKQKLSALGIRHIRDKAHLSTDENYNEKVYSRYRDLASVGIGSNLIVDPRNLGLASVNQQKISAIAQRAGGALESFEGPNEYDVSGSADWVTNLRAYQRTLYGSVKGNESTSSVPVIGPSLAHARNADTLGDLSAYMDYGNMHPYPGGEHPASWSLDNYNVINTRKVSGTKRLMPTETGYHTAANWTGDHRGVSERAAGRYVPRLFLEYFNRGFVRTYSYELMDLKPDPNGEDREKNFGLVRNDGTEKPAYTALKNTIGLLKDPGPAFTTGSLDYSLSGDTKDVHRTLLQKRDGRFYLVLWQEVPSYDLSAKKDILVPDRKVTLTLNTPTSEAVTYLPGNSSAAVARRDAPKQMDLAVPDHPLVVEITPLGASAVPNTAPSISNLRPASTTKDRTPTVRATVRDAQTNLSKTNIRLYLDGRRKSTFAYDRTADRLKYRSKKLSFGRHSVKIVARDAAGLTKTRSWSFKVVR